MKRRIKLLPASAVAITAVLLAASASHRLAASSISADPDFNTPRFVQPSPAIYVQLLPDGKFLRFGSVDTLVAQPSGPLTRYLPDGSLDTSFRFTRDYDSVLAALALPDGKLIVSASRSVYGASSTEEILRLNQDGSIDPMFKKTVVSDEFTGTVRAFVLQPDGRIITSGFFFTFGGQQRPGIVRLLPDGRLDSTFAEVPLDGSLSLNTVVLQPDGKIIIYGSFASIGTESFPAGVARLNADGTVDASFQPSGFDRATSVRSAVRQPDGKIVLGGRFSVAADFAANPTGDVYSNLPLVRLNPDGSADQTYGHFDSDSRSFLVRDMKLQPDGKVVATTISGALSVFRFAVDGSLDTTFRQPVFTTEIWTGGPRQPIQVALQSDGRILVSGFFSDVDTDSPNESNLGLARLNSDGTVDRSFTTQTKTGLTDFPKRFARLANGSTYIAFRGISSAGGTSVPHNFARLRPNGSLDASFNPFTAVAENAPLTSDFTANGFAPLRDGKFLVFGANQPFEGAYGRLRSDGSQDLTFVSDPAVAFLFSNSAVDAIEALPQPNNAVLISSPDAQTILYGGLLARIAPNGSSDDSFQLDPSIASQAVVRGFGDDLVGVSADSRVLAVQPDGKILFVYLQSDTSSRLVRLNGDGSLDDSFAPVTIRPLSTSVSFPQLYDPVTQQTLQPPNGVVQGQSVADVEIMSNERIVIAGPFDSINGAATRGMARLNSNGTVDTSFKIGNGPGWRTVAEVATRRPLVEQVESQSSGKLLITGTFESFKGVAAPGIASLNADGSVDTSFVPPAIRQKAYRGASVLDRQRDGSFLLSGPYSYPGETVPRSLIRLLEPTAAVNISTRMAVGTGDNVLIAGLIVTGDAPKKVIIRGLGPSLSSGGTGVPGRLNDTVLELRASDISLIMRNDDWRSTQQQAIVGSTLAPADDRESAIVATLQPGNYTAILSGKDNTTGIGLVEVYDLDTDAPSQLAQISTRGFVQTGDDVMIGGFILSGGNATSVLVRAIGPTVPVTGALQDTVLELYNGDGVRLAANDDWRSDQEQSIIATGVPPSDDRESAILHSAAAGNYTAIVRGKDNTTGIGLVEVYVLQ